MLDVYQMESSANLVEFMILLGDGVDVKEGMSIFQVNNIEVLFVDDDGIAS
ncbi:hypothetical protein ACJ51O_37190 (plasmid) [Burkholderia pyrrocinia]|uniref:hypothetical protein n=1 Tax=Burkholderia pyrrocinia TaxID=60550 RepID=UPI0038B48F2F